MKNQKDIQVRVVIKEELFTFEKIYNEVLYDNNRTVNKLLDYLKKDIGKLIRPSLFFLSEGLAGKTNLESVPVAVLIELLHNATIIHDDIVDNGEKRRGREAAHKRWSKKSSVLLGDYLLAKVLKIGVESRWPQVLDITTKIVLEMAREELSQSLKKSITVPAEEEYFNMIRFKTGGLFKAACELGGVVSGADYTSQRYLSELGTIFGTIYQIQDDILDYIGNEEKTGKEVRKDLFNGSITLPFIYVYSSINKNEQSKLVDFIRSGDSDKIHYVYDFVIKQHGVEMAQEKMSNLLEQVLKILMEFPCSDYREALTFLTKSVLRRSV